MGSLLTLLPLHHRAGVGWVAAGSCGSSGLGMCGVLRGEGAEGISSEDCARLWAVWDAQSRSSEK